MEATEVVVWWGGAPGAGGAHVTGAGALAGPVDPTDAAAVVILAVGDGAMPFTAAVGGTLPPLVTGGAGGAVEG